MAYQSVTLGGMDIPTYFVKPDGQDTVWVVYYEHWGEDGETVEAICATEELAREWIEHVPVVRLDYQVRPEKLLTTIGHHGVWKA